MDFNEIAKISEALKTIQPKSYSLSIEMSNGEKFAFAKEEPQKEKVIGFQGGIKS